MIAAPQDQPAEETLSSEAASPLFSPLPVLLGDHELTELLGQHELSDTYIARQSHAERRVVLEVLRPLPDGDEEAAISYFLSLARARGAAHLPHTAAVLESATSPEGYTYICQAHPEGIPLSAMAAKEQRLTGPQACALICAAAELYEACAKAELPAGELSADMVFLNRKGDFHFLSPVQVSCPADGASARQLHALATLIRSVQPINVPGQGRIATLLQWMQEGYEGEALDWPAAVNTAKLIDAQIQPQSLIHAPSPQRYDRGREQRASKRRRRQQRRGTLLAGAALCCILAMGAGGIYLAPDTVPPIPALRGGYVHANMGEKVVRVDAHPVSIAQYQHYLEEFPSLDAFRRGSLTQNIPPTESDPTPADWEAQRSAPQQDAPVTNVSYWQALMYARYQRASLPSAALLSATRAEAGQPNIEEWTQDELTLPSPYTKARLVLPANITASPIPENNPAARSPQRGFRLCH